MTRLQQEVITLDPHSEQIEVFPRLGILRADTRDVYALAINPAETTQSSMLVPQPWSGFVRRRDSLAYHGLIANCLGGALTIAVDNPGVGSGELDHMGRQAVANGDFTAVAEQQWRSIDRLVEADAHIDSPRAVLAYSLGAAVSSALIANAPDDTRFERLVLWEAVGISKMSFATLLRRFAAEQPDWLNYKKENTPPIKELQAGTGQIARQFWREREALLAYGRASAHATVMPNLEVGRKRGVIDSNTRITVVSGAKSRVSPVGVNTDLAWHLAEQGFDTHQVVLEQESHGMIDSLGRVAALLDYLRES